MTKSKLKGLITPMDQIQPPSYASKECCDIAFRLKQVSWHVGTFTNEDGSPRKFARLVVEELYPTETPIEAITAGGDIVMIQLQGIPLELLPICFMFHKSGNQVYMEEIEDPSA